MCLICIIHKHLHPLIYLSSRQNLLIMCCEKFELRLGVGAGRRRKKKKKHKYLMHFASQRNSLEAELRARAEQCGGFINNITWPLKERCWESFLLNR